MSFAKSVSLFLRLITTIPIFRKAIHEICTRAISFAHPHGQTQLHHMTCTSNSWELRDSGLNLICTAATVKRASHLIQKKKCQTPQYMYLLGLHHLKLYQKTVTNRYTTKNLLPTCVASTEDSIKNQRTAPLPPKRTSCSPKLNDECPPVHPSS